MADRVPLTDLEVITRFSLAVRAATADRDEVIAALRADLAWLEGAPAKRPAAPARAPAPAPRPAAPAKKAAAKTATAKKAAAARAKPAR